MGHMDAATAWVPPQPGDGVAIARATGRRVTLRAHAAGEALRRGGREIGRAARDLPAGVDLTGEDLLPPAAFAAPTPRARPTPPLTFRGFRRADGRVGTRNLLAVLVVGNCGATTARQVAEAFDAARLAPYPNVQGVIPLVHELGCGMEMTGEPMDLLRRSLAGHIRHPNVVGAVVIALGCERNNLRVFLDEQRLTPGPLLATVTIQEEGGIARAAARAIAALEAMLPAANSAERVEAPLAALTLAVQGSAPDGFTGASAFPAIGAAADLLLAAGGTVILSEVPELLPAAEALLARAATPDARAAIAVRLDWWRRHARGRLTALDAPLDRRAAAAGLLTPIERALDALEKAGTAPIQGMVRYAEAPPGPGLWLMDGPDDDAACTTGQAAAGATLVALGTGRGTGFGALPAPVVKVAASTALFRRMEDDMDLDAGPVLEGAETVVDAGARLLDGLLRHASGMPTRAEVEGATADAFAPWPVGVLA